MEQFSVLQTLARSAVPSAKKARVTPVILKVIINDVCRDINARLHLLSTDDKFNVVADQYKYDLSDSSETVDRYFKTDKMGLWWNAGTASAPDWRRLFPKTLKWLDKNFEGWRNQDGDDPIYYAKHGRFITLYPTPDTALTDGFWLYYIENTINMDKSTDYPFGNTVEIPEYSSLTYLIIKGVEAWLDRPVGKDQEGSQAFIEYIGMIEDAKLKIKGQLDIQSDRKTKITLPVVC